MKKFMQMTEEDLGVLYLGIQTAFSKGNYDLLLDELDKFIEIARLQNSLKYEGVGLNLKGYTFYLRNEVCLAIKAYELGLVAFLKHPELYYKEIKENKNSLGVLYRKNGEFKKALLSLLGSIEVSEKYNIINSIAYNNIATAYSERKDYGKALYYYQIAFEIGYNSPNPDGSEIIKCLTNIATINTKIGAFEEADAIYSKTLDYCKSTNSFDVLVTSLKGKAIWFIEKNDFVNAEIFLKRALQLSNKISFKVQLLDILLCYAKVYHHTNHFDKQLSSLIIAYEEAEKSNKPKVVEVLEALVQYYKQQRLFQNASEYMRKLIEIKEERFTKEKEEKFFELQDAFESKQKDKLLLNERSFQGSLKAKQSELLKALQEQKSLDLHLRSLQLQLSPHFIFNTLQSIQSFIFEKDPIQASDYLAKFAGLMRAILKASRQGSLSLLEEKELLESYLILEQQRFDHQFTYQIEIQKGLIMEEQSLPSLLIQPFVENAILHGVSNKQSGLIKIVFRKKQEKLYIHIIDNGRGRAVSRKCQQKNRIGSSTALIIMQERALVSKESKIIFNFKIRDLKQKGKALGTHVMLSLEELL
jgi:sensor histidine kinase YesM